MGRSSSIRAAGAATEAPRCAIRAPTSASAIATFYLGEIADVPFYIGAQQFEYWRHTHLTIDIVPGRGGGFSLEAPTGYRFLTRSRLYEDQEWRELEAAGPPPHGPQAEHRA